jgi:colicin import membrane protein
MPTFSRPGAGLMLVALLGASVYGYERLWPRNASRSEEASKQAAQAPTPAPPAAAPSAPSAPAATAAIEPPARMTPAQQASFDAWLIKTYLSCWRPAPLPADADLYVAQVRLAFNPDGTLSKPAKLVNPPSDPALKPQAKSVMLAVQNCNPLPVPAQYRPFYEQWKTKSIHFNPQVAAR